MTALFAALFELLTPMFVVFASISTIVAFLLGALADPQGWMNSVICTVIDNIASIFPSTPDNLKIGNMIETLITNIGTSMPMVGVGIVRETFTTIISISALAIAIKIYKLLPFKAS